MFVLHKHLCRICSRVSSKFSTYNVIKIDDIKNANDFALTNNELTTNCDKDVSLLTPYVSKSFNIAAFVNTSDSLKKLVNLNVNLSKIEKKPYLMEKLLKLDFEKDIKNHIFFLSKYVDANFIGEFISKNPSILHETLDDLNIRVNYLLSKNFAQTQIQHIIMKNPFWLLFNTKRIDRRLGFFQQKYDLTSKEVKHLATKQPKLITYNLHHVNTNSFVLKEEIGFTDKDIKSLLLDKPKLFMLSQLHLSRRFNYIHNVIKIPHEMILQSPKILLCREFRVKQRHIFLEKLGRAQFDPKKENYIPILALAEKSDLEFCKTYAKCSIDDFNSFLKTL